MRKKVGASSPILKSNYIRDNSATNQARANLGEKELPSAGTVFNLIDDVENIFVFDQDVSRA